MEPSLQETLKPSVVVSTQMGEGMNDETPVLEWKTLLVILRILRSWSQQDLADASGVAVSTIARQEQGGSTPMDGTREKLEKAFGVDGAETRGLQVSLGLLQAGMLDPEKRAIQGLEQAGALAAQMAQASLRKGIAEMRELAEDEAPVVERLPMGFDELRRESEEERPDDPTLPKATAFRGKRE